MEGKDLVSVIINTHNGAKYLNKSINSILLQSYENFEIIIWDNASTDHTKQLVTSYLDHRIKYYYSEKFQKLYEARNQALNVSNGRYITFLDSDDSLTENSIGLRLDVLKNSDKLVCYSNLFISKNFKKKKIFYDRTKKSGNIFSEIIQQYDICFISLMFKKEIFNEYKFNPNFNIIGDFDFILKISKKYDFVYCDVPVGIYNIHLSNFTNLHEHIHAEELKSWMGKNFKNLLDNNKIYKKPIILKYLVLKKFYKIKKMNIKQIIIFFFKIKKNFFFVLLLKKYLSFFILKIFK